jgi:lysophospholipase L1-like esterase
MLECLIVGDSIAVGTKMFAPHCELQGKGGINTWQFNRMYKGSFYADTVIISLGSNDHKGVKTYDELFEMRQRVGAKNVFWVLPAGNLPAGGVPIEKIQSIVKELAVYYGDTVLPIRGLQADGIHPSWSGYKNIVERTKE